MPEPAVIPLAYLDPGSGSLLLHFLLGLVASAWVLLRTFGGRIKGLFRRSAPDESEPAMDEPPAEGS